MLKFPVIVFSYGAFGADQKKLYVYELDGVPLFPIFSDSAAAAKFQTEHQQVLAAHGDQRKLTMQICQKPQYMRDILTVIAAISPDVATIAINPADGKAALHPIDDIIQELDSTILTS